MQNKTPKSAFFVLLCHVALVLVVCMPFNATPAAGKNPFSFLHQIMVAASPGPVNSPVKDKWALIIGISNFQRPEYNLKYAAKDAVDFGNYLVKEANFSKDHVRVLVNEQATRENIMSAFGDTWLPRIVRPGDLVVVYVSTHGTPASRDRGGENYIVAHDTNRDKLYATGISMTELNKRIKQSIKTDRALIVLDTCYSGGATHGARGAETPANFDASEIAQGTGHLVICSSGQNQQSYESKNATNGIFTRHLIDALRANKGTTDVKQAFMKMKDQVSWEVQRDWGAEQVPQLGGQWEGKQLILSVPPSEPRAMVGESTGETSTTSTTTQPSSPGGPGPTIAMTIPTVPAVQTTPPPVAMPALPRALRECETSDAARWGDWVLDASGRRYLGTWQGADAKAELVVQKFDGHNIELLRTDRSGSSYGLTGRYTGTWDGASSRFKGDVSWTWQGSTWGGTWQAYPVAATAKDMSSRCVSGQWNSDFGPVTLEEIPVSGNKSTVRGYWTQDASKTGEIRSGTFDPATGELTFTYYEPWLRVTGTGRFRLSDDGRLLNGSWTQPGMSGSWIMRR